MSIASREKGTVLKVPLIAADKALLSLRSSGHDYCSAIGEVIDNSLQANANSIRVKSLAKTRRRLRSLNELRSVMTATEWTSTSCTTH